MKYLKQLSELFDPLYLRGERQEISQEAAERFSGIPDIIEKFKPVIEKNINIDNLCRAKSWEYLKVHGGIYSIFAKMLEARAECNHQRVKELWAEVSNIVRKNEDIIQPAFDVYLFIQTIEKKLKVNV